MHKSVLVVGGGIAGIQAGLDLADMGIEVYLVERAPSIGGRMSQLDKTFPTNDCAMCILSPKLVEAGAHPYINIITNAEVLSLVGEPPNFHATILKRPRYVIEGKCTGCGICMAKCPVKIPDEYNKALTKTKCIRIPFPQAVPAIPIMDKESCIYHKRGKCRICEKFCEMEAIDFSQQDEIIEVDIGSVILAVGCEEFDSTLKDEYGYRTFANVMTSIELERILSPSGPTQGQVVRPSDGKEPRNIAFVQCVGSRDMQMGPQYCSAVCCMQAAKHSVILREHIPRARSTIFYMDLRAYGKDFDRFIERAKSEYQTRFVHARISSVEVDPLTENLIIQYNTDAGKIKRDVFELVVLSVGLVSTERIEGMARRLGIDLSEYGFCESDTFNPVGTSRPGVFVAGIFSGPKDIPETVMEASGSASAASGLLTGLPVKEIREEMPAELNVAGEPPRIGVFVCRCGVNIAATVDVPEVVRYASRLPHVVWSQELLFACSQDSQKMISERIKEERLNRIVVSACTPRTHEPLFQKTLQKVGLNPYLFEFANIREHCSWVHQKEPEEATTKAKDLVRMAVSRVKFSEPLPRATIQIGREALVIGGGVAGMIAARDLAAHGFHVHLVEKEEELGGNFRQVRYMLNGEESWPFLDSLIEEIESNGRIRLYKSSVVKQITGYVGNFRTRVVDGGGKEEEIDHGAVIVATGAREYRPTEYCYGDSEDIVSQLQLEERLGRKEMAYAVSKMQNVVMIQCVGTRDEERPYCSRICCSQAIKNALRLRELNRKLNIYILYQDIRTYGMREIHYKKAREKGVIFLRYEAESRPEIVCSDEKVRVKVRDLILGRDLFIDTDLLVLSAGIVPNEQNKELSQMLKVPLNADGFFLEAHVKLRPVDFATEGIFVCGLAHYPKDVSETIAQARAAASRATVLLSRESLEAEGKVSAVRKERCTGCGLCVEVCAYQAIEVDETQKAAVVNEALCKGCGVCASSCRSAAIDLKGFRNEEILMALEVA